MTFIAGIKLLDFNLFFGTKSRFLQLDLHVVTQVRPVLPIFCLRVAAEKRLENSATESALAEDFAENIERIVKTAAETGATLSKRSVAETVIGGAFIRVQRTSYASPSSLNFSSA